jgi:hypothetical protein
VLVHDTVGVDAALQVSALAQVILNQDCRTVRGWVRRVVCGVRRAIREYFVVLKGEL